ncbi:hypothetical protein VTL71DRAFT_4470 [Oculimacula yallundae]|uniref:Uncharacterized protein n=1 Tax=Oculimacula yallundae TaxID=86028 RepID=A0ABR4C3N0_9HELO
MAPVRDENQWTTVHELTVNDDCPGFEPDFNSTPSSGSSFTLEGSSDISEIGMRNETSLGRDTEASTSETAGLESPFRTHVKCDEDRFQNPVNSRAGAPRGEVNVPRSIRHPNTNAFQDIAPNLIKHRQIPRGFQQFQGADLLALFPEFFDVNPPSDVEEWVQRCESSGVGIPYLDSLGTETSAREAQQQNFVSEASRTRNRKDSQQYGSGPSNSDSSEPAYRQIDTQPQNKNRKLNDEEDEKEDNNDDS